MVNNSMKCLNKGVLESKIFENSQRGSISLSRPEMCECFKVARRPLDFDKLNVPMLNNNFLNNINKEISHKHGFFKGSGQDIGFGGNGIFSESFESKNYKLDSTCYDGQVARDVIRNTEEGSYHFLRNNCQRYIQKIIEGIKSFSNVR